MLREEKITDFIEALASSSPVPGGGGVCALAGALGAALGNMVASLTVGKKKYAAVEDEIKALAIKMEEVRTKLVECIDRDAECFEPLAKAYGLPAGTEEEKAAKASAMESGLKLACTVPVEIMELSCRAIELQKEFAEKGSVLAVSDAGVGAVLCKAALKGASLNVFINTGMMKDREYAQKLDAHVQKMIDDHSRLADEVFGIVEKKIRK